MLLTVAWCGSVSSEQLVWHATAVPSRTYPFSSDQGSQTGLGSISTRLSDRPGTLSAVVSLVFKLACCVCIVCSVSCFMLACCICAHCAVHRKLTACQRVSAAQHSSTPGSPPMLPGCLFTLTLQVTGSAAWAPTPRAHLVGPKAKGHAPTSQQVHAAVHCDVLSSSFSRCADHGPGLRRQSTHA